MKHTSYLSLAADILSDFSGAVFSHMDEYNCWGAPLEFESDTIDGAVHLMNTFIKKVQKYQEV